MEGHDQNIPEERRVWEKENEVSFAHTEFEVPMGPQGKEVQERDASVSFEKEMWAGAMDVSAVSV